MATITKRIDSNGKPYYTAQIRLLKQKETATFKRITDAKKWVQDTESAIREGRHFKTAEAKKHTVSELITRYCSEYLPNNKKRTYSLKEQKERASRLGWWSGKIGHLVLADVTPMVITEHVDAMTQGAATVDKYIKNLSHAFSIAVSQWGWVTDNPIKKVGGVSLPDGRIRFLDDDERESLLIACKVSPNPLLYPCVVLALSTGMRQTELMELKWADVYIKRELVWSANEYKSGYLILYKTKNGERRRVPLSGLALSILQEHAKIRRIDTPLLFPSTRYPQQPIDLRKAFANALKAAEITNFKWHDLRHCTASYLAMNKASMAEIAEILGHKTLSMSNRYSHLSDGHVSNVVASMNKKIFGGV